MAGAGEEFMAGVWAEVPVRVDWAAVAAQCAWAGAQARAFLVVPAIRLLVVLSLAMTVMILLEKIFVAAVCFAAKAFGHRPERRYQWRPIAAGAAAAARGDEEAGLVVGGGGSAAFPVVLVQIPMYNEREVYKLSIGAACALEWPSDRVVIQVLDDSTDPAVKDLVEIECQRWKGKGVNIKYEVRGNRKGYKAGALKEGLKHDYVQECEFIAMFDADFQPESDFLLRTVPFLVHNPDIALVQTRWKFVNSDECLLTRFQEMSLDYHFKFEQEAGSIVYSFFGFNGTAGVWRISAIDDAGGWKDRTTVEDMDLAVRTALKGWKFVYVGAVKE
uniref:glucomannan 4-beta-mannosyltransferase n=1 Tax=Aegilops tauschii subsp. strangulata TaxID=200361 RepID=A0A453GQK4_AEGTS